MSAEDDQDMLAAEYALGSLDADEREEAQRLIASDPAFAARVQHWERRLGELHQMVDPVEPPDDLWPKILAKVRGVEPSELRLPEIFRARTPAAPAVDAEVIALSGRVRRWRA